ncbi:bacterial capsule synthesis protein [Anaerococcus hydrogenalis DSM 7454]|uniref:Bacterial capsule synthesis protein n=1 Tax=Anaerococcus hydrogenalis DSM 7454 TaxID=561177 RepID=B6W6Q9_9FIRM|nr:CapA family protein [Anaerococcus hydrogenalis]EEB37002.1 bacterial capsule synthesis protein [Anaerococcus hydrogenalis DSM 7454]
MKKYRKILSLLLVFLMAFSLSSCKKQDGKSNISSDISVSNKEVKKENDKNKGIIKIDKKRPKKFDEKSKDEIINIKAGGDLMAHMDQVDYARNYGNGKYDFSNQFEYVKDFLKDSDLTIGNFETSVSKTREPSGYPQFTTPKEYIRDIKDAGFDMLSTANNHSVDSFEEGIFDTIDAMDEYGIAHAGTRKPGEDRFIYRNVKGLKVSFMSYTYGVNGLDSLVTENKPEDVINYLEPEKIKADIKEAKKNKADLIIVYPHWGVEYQSYPTDDQIKLGRDMIDWGADLVIGNHPHVTQPAERYKSKDGKEGYIAYSCGNFIACQSYDVLGDIRTEQSVLYDINILRNNKTGKIKLGDVKIHPIWNGHMRDENGYLAKDFMIEDFLEGGKYYDKVNETQRERIRKCDEMIIKTVNTKVE